MADLNVNSIGDASGGNTATINSYTPTESNMAGRNRLINSDMRIDQRNAGASVTFNGTEGYTLDRWLVAAYGGGIPSVQQSTTAPAGFVNSLGITVSTVDSSIAAGDLYVLTQKIEGNNTADLAWGTASAQSITISFKVRCSVTGTFSGAVANATPNRAYPFTFTINAANTFEDKVITIPGDTTGTWGTGNGTGLELRFDLGSGTNFKGTAGAWGSGNIFGSTGSTNLIATSGATFYLTGVQLEAGSVATPFERRQYGQELALCQRYAQPNKAASGRFNTGGTTPAFVVPLSPPMRTASPSIVELELSGKLDEFWVSNRSISSGSVAVYNASGTDGLGVLCTSSTTGTASGIVGLFANAFLFVTEL